MNHFKSQIKFTPYELQGYKATQQKRLPETMTNTDTKLFKFKKDFPFFRISISLAKM